MSTRRSQGDGCESRKRSERRVQRSQVFISYNVANFRVHHTNKNYVFYVFVWKSIVISSEAEVKVSLILEVEVLVSGCQYRHMCDTIAIGKINFRYQVSFLLGLNLSLGNPLRLK